ncbi:SDR family oxidoreductase [Escherichia coli]|uniref:SDR family oxidoreductase n=1 Tax=Escherichia coli TaxID=562 RepID=UPI0038B43097
MGILFITGATGFLGGAVLERFLDRNPEMNVLLLVRAADPLSGLERVRENMRRFNISEDVLRRLTVSHILPGDLSEPDGYLSDPRLELVTHVINCAAVASFGNNPLVWKVNVEGTHSLARRMAEVSGLRCFLHISTAMACTPEAHSLVTEDELSETGEHLVEYTRSKAAAERLLRQQCPGLPLLIARPSIVVGHTRHGCQPSTSIFWVFRMGLMLQKFMCSMDDYIDVVPVDYCADALLRLLRSPFISGEVVHISAGEEGSVTFADIDRAMAQALGTEPVGEKYAQVGYDTLVMMRHQFRRIFGPCNERLMLRAIRLYGAFSMLDVRFSNEKLLETGMPKPPRFTEYLGRCVQTTRGLSIPQQMAVDFK